MQSAEGVGWHHEHIGAELGHFDVMEPTCCPGCFRPSLENLLFVSCAVVCVTYRGVGLQMRQAVTGDCCCLRVGRTGSQNPKRVYTSLHSIWVEIRKGIELGQKVWTGAHLRYADKCGARICVRALICKVQYTLTDTRNDKCHHECADWTY
eukprot:1195127-Prorocentrum_minimum.AAC.1